MLPKFPVCLSYMPIQYQWKPNVYPCQIPISFFFFVWLQTSNQQLHNLLFSYVTCYYIANECLRFNRIYCTFFGTRNNLQEILYNLPFRLIRNGEESVSMCIIQFCMPCIQMLNRVNNATQKCVVTNTFNLVHPGPSRY